MVHRRGFELRSPAFKADMHDNHYTTGESTASADEIAQLIFITSLRSWGRILAGEPYFRIARYILLLHVDIF